MCTHIITEYVEVVLVVGRRHDDVAHAHVLVVVGVVRHAARHAHQKHVLHVTERAYTESQDDNQEICRNLRIARVCGELLT